MLATKFGCYPVLKTSAGDIELEAFKYNSWGPYNRGLGADPGVQGGGRSPSPWSCNTFGFWTFNGSRKFAHFCKISKRTKSDTICVVFAKNEVK